MRTWRISRARIDVISVRQIENPLLYRRYIARRREITLSAQGRRQPIVELGNLPDEKDIATNVNGKWRLSCMLASAKVLHIRIPVCLCIWSLSLIKFTNKLGKDRL